MQLTFRQLVFDTTFVRDIGIFVLCAIFFTNGGHIDGGFKMSSLYKWIKIYLVYGILMVFIHLTTGGDIVPTIVLYRNHFFPFILFYIALYIMQEERFRIKWTNLLFLLFVILIGDIYIEKLMEITGVSRSILPWYQYQFFHYYRFNTAPDHIPNAISPEDSPILGFLGYPNPTSCAITALFCFFLPFLLHEGINSNDVPYVMRLSKKRRLLLTLLGVGAMAILQIKTPFISLVVCFLLYLLFDGKRNIKPIVVTGVLLTIVGYLTYGLWGDTFIELSEETKGEEGFNYIFDMQFIGALLQSVMDTSFIGFLTGVSNGDSLFLEKLEVRLVMFTITLGLLWLLCFVMIVIKSYGVFSKILKQTIYKSSLDRTMSIGIFLLLVNYILDFLHYAHALYLFHFDIIAVSLAILVVINVKLKQNIQ